MWDRIARFIALALLVLCVGFASAETRSIDLAIGALSGPGFSAQAVRLELDGAGLPRAKLRIGELQALDRVWRDVAISCSAFRLERSLIACDAGRLEGSFALPLTFSYDVATGNGKLVVSPGGRERWQVDLTGGTQRRAVLTISDASIARIHAFVPALPVKISAGTADGVLRASFGAGRMHVEGELTLRKIAFSDAAGLRAGESIGGKIALRADAQNDVWQWRLDTSWLEGEIFWDPIYSKAGYRLTAEGGLTPSVLRVDRATLAVSDVGEVRITASLDRASHAVDQARVETSDMRVASLYARFLKPALGDTVFGQLRSEGMMRASLTWQAGRLAEANVELDGVSVEDERGRFALFGVYASLPWKSGAATEGRIGMSGAEVQRLPIGAVGTALEITAEEVHAAQLAIPVLSGLLTLNDLRVRNAADGIAWQVHGTLSPVPLDVLLAHFGLPAMQGSISGEIPRVRYERSTLQVDGALLIRVFDGTVKATALKIESPLGLAPRLQTNLEARNLDLGLVTRTFSFGSITGKVDAQIDGLVLSNWRPVRFDARIESSPGNYPKRISQTAVNNISALGGAGATVAIQRSVLRFFETFGYSKLGISCRLREDVCRMGGIEDLPQGYVIVKGGGIPAINVLGYNRDVGWDELLTRLKRVIDSNVKPTIQ